MSYAKKRVGPYVSILRIVPVSLPAKKSSMEAVAESIDLMTPPRMGLMAGPAVGPAGDADSNCSYNVQGSCSLPVAASRSRSLFPSGWKA